MNIGRAIAYGIMREVERDWRRRETSVRLQREAAARPGSIQVQTPVGTIWMSPIERKLYEAMVKEDLAPVPQHCIEGYYADFAFPDVRLAVEADGAVYHDGERRQRDQKRDWIMRRAGWTVQRFRGKTIHQKAGNCAYVVKREVDGRRRAIRERMRLEAMRRQARRDALLRPFRAIVKFFRKA